MRFELDDGGREDAGFRGTTGDCVTRAIAIAVEKPYLEVYEALFASGKKTPRNGVPRRVYEKYLASLGWKFHATMFIGSGCKVHLKASELPSGNLVARLSHHLVAVKDGVLHDTYDCSREETRCVYGYYLKV